MKKEVANESSTWTFLWCFLNFIDKAFLTTYDHMKSSKDILQFDLLSHYGY